MSKVVVFDAITQTETIRDMTEEELEQKAIDEANALTALEAENAKKAQRQSLLEKLGITEEEAQLLLK